MEVCGFGTFCIVQNSQDFTFGVLQLRGSITIKIIIISNCYVIFKIKFRQSPNCVKNDPRDVIKWGRWEEKWERKLLKKRWIIPHFYDVTWMNFDTIWALSKIYIGTILMVRLYNPSSPKHMIYFNIKLPWKSYRNLGNRLRDLIRHEKQLFL